MFYIKNRGVILIFFLFIYFKLNQTLIQSEYECSFNLLSKILNVSLEYNKDSKNRYNFCGSSNKGFETMSCDGGNNVVLSISLGSNRSTILSSSDFNCFSSIDIIMLNLNYKFEKNFLYGFSKIIPHFLSYYTDESLFDLDFNIDNSKAILIDRFIIKKLKIKKNYNLYFSSLKNVSIFELEYGPSNYQINYINDLIEIKNFISINIFSSNIPSMKNINILELVLNLLPSFNLESFSNFSTFSNVKSICLNPINPSDIFPFPLPLCDLAFNNSLESLEINYQIDKPLDFIDLSVLENLFLLLMPNVGPLFNVDGEFPFVKINRVYSRFVFSNGRINNFYFINSSTLEMENNGMKGMIPTTYPNIDISLKGNQLEGEIDESWCGKLFDISDNYISGELPSCFKCHYLQPSVSSTLSGNRFKNFNPNNLEPCLDLELNLVYNHSFSKSLTLYGKNLGPFYDSLRIYDMDSIGILPIKGCKEYKIRKSFWEPGEIPRTINITFPFLPQGPRTFEISAYNEFLPQIHSIIRYSDYFIISGKYFAYNQSVINVLISNHSCSIITSNFNEIQCYLSNSNQIINNNNEELITSIIQIMNVSSTFNFTVNRACNDSNCPIAHCNKYGEYNYESGVCDCYSNEWRGYSCELKSLNCLSNDCSGNGYCNGIIGKCECNKNRIFDDCSGILCNDVCLNGGNCNFQIGICNCSSKWIESSGCSIPKQSIDSQQLEQIENEQILALFGWFGNINRFLTILIDGKSCDIISNDNETIQCYPPNYQCDFIKTSSLELSVSQNNFIWNGIYNPIFINACSNSNEDSSINNSYSSNSDKNNQKENSSSNSQNLVLILSILLSLILLGLLGLVFFKKLIIKNNYLNNNKFNENKIRLNEYDNDQPDDSSKNKIKLIIL
ncbi:hypothetical protein ACTFIZ_002216 [Dictyostelium cf. discoideum]